MVYCTITMSNGRFVGTTGDYAGALNMTAMNSPLSDCGVTLRCDAQGVPEFVIMRITQRDFVITVASVPVENSLIVGTINGVSAGNTLQQLFDNLSAAIQSV